MNNIVSFLPFAGIIIGAFLQYIFTRHIEHARALKDMKVKAYMDYLRGVCEQAQLSLTFDKKSAQEKKSEAFIRIADAKARICLYGSSSVIHAFAEFERLGAQIATQEQIKAFVSMSLEMRKDAGLKSLPSENDIRVVLLGR